MIKTIQLRIGDKNMIFRIHFTYDASTHLKKLTKEQFEELKNSIPDFPDDIAENRYSYTPILNDKQLELLMAYCPEGIELRNFKNTYFTNSHGLPDLKGLMNGGTHIHIPNIGLLTVRKVKILEDCCTDVLQQELDEGWSLIAVCPPNAVRRPDYILGKS